jgi:uncharacterized protein YbjT (DUF2867 family)
VPDSETILVTGATGNTGSPMLPMLDASDVSVRAMIRTAGDEARLTPSATPVVADFDDGASLEAALNGVTRAYLVTPSSAAAQKQQVRFAELAEQAGVMQIVLLSQYASDEHSPVRFLRYHAAVERRIRELGIGFTFLRPNLFFQGLFAIAGTIASDGRFFAPIGDARVSAVDVRDIAAVAVAVLTEPGHEGKTYTITGPAAITHSEIADALSVATGRQIAFVDVPPDAVRASLEGVLPDWQLGGLLEDYEHYVRGEADDVLPTVAEITGREPRDVVRFAHDYTDRFTKRPAERHRDDR